jgi:hypothetical protein
MNITQSLIFSYSSISGRGPSYGFRGKVVLATFGLVIGDIIEFVNKQEK